MRLAGMNSQGKIPHDLEVVMIHELGTREATALLDQSSLGRLGCSLHNEPYVVPVYYWHSGESVFIHSMPGLKLGILRANPHACLQVDDITDPYHWRSVIAFGLYEAVTDPAEHDRALVELFKRLSHLTPVESRMGKRADQSVVFRLRITRLTGIYEDWR
jgi:hypothetical protein